MSNSIKRLVFVSMQIVILIGLVLFISKFEWSDSARQASIARLNSIFHGLKIGMSAGDLSREMLKKMGGEELFSRMSGDYEYWYISSPKNILQSHWVLRICIRNELVAGAAFGTGDNINIAPAGAPPSKGSCS